MTDADQILERIKALEALKQQRDTLHAQIDELNERGDLLGIARIGIKLIQLDGQAAKLFGLESVEDA